MNFVAKLKSTKAVLSTVAMAAAMVAPGAAQADAVAQAILDVNNFKITLSNPAAIQSLSGTSSGDTSATLNGNNVGNVASVAVTNPAGFSLSDATGPNSGSFSPLTALVGAPTGTFAGSHSSVVGSSLLPAGARASVDNVVSLFPAGDGSAESNVSLTANIQFALTQSSTVAFNFDAVGFLRSYLAIGGNQFGEANADYNWSMQIRRQRPNGTFETLVRWVPDGVMAGAFGVTGIIGGTETQDDFNMTNGVSLTNFNGDDQVANSGSFAMTTNLLSAGTYFLSISHSSDVNAFVSVSEPQMLGLAGLALLGVGAFTRRRRA